MKSPSPRMESRPAFARTVPVIPSPIAHRPSPILTILALAFTLALARHAVTQVLIDDFSAGDFAISGNVPFETHSGAGILGGSRRVALYNGSGSSASVSSGVLTITKADNQTTFLSRYGAYNAPYGGGNETGADLNLDISANQFVQFTVQSMSAPFTLSVSAVDGSGGSGGGFRTISSPGTYSIQINPGGGPFNYSDVAGLELTPGFASEQGTFAIAGVQFVNSVPEPVDYAAFSAVGLAVFAISRSIRSRCCLRT